MTKRKFLPKSKSKPKPEPEPEPIEAEIDAGAAEVAAPVSYYDPEAVQPEPPVEPVKRPELQPEPAEKEQPPPLEPWAPWAPTKMKSAEDTIALFWRRSPTGLDPVELQTAAVRLSELDLSLEQLSKLNTRGPMGLVLKRLEHGAA